jgi:ribosomal protein L37AE/L43A
MELWMWILIGVGAVCLLILFAYFSRMKCPKCKKRNCAEVSRKETEREQVLFEEEEVITHVENKKGLSGGFAKSDAQVQAKFGAPSSTTVRKYKVPGERVHYLVTYKCNECEHSFTGTAYEDIKPRTVR